MTSTDLTKKLHDLARNPEQHCHGSFVLCLLTGGNSETVVMADNSKLNTDEILDRLDSNNFPAMAGKPKFVFFDVDSPNSMMDTGIRVPKDTHEELWDRRTGDLKPIQVRSRNSTSLQDIVRQRDTSAPIVTDYISFVARKADFVIFLASFPQYKALHNCHMGSIATRVLVEVFYKHSHSHHVVLLGQKIRRKLGSKTLQKMKQVLTTIDTLSKDFYLFPPTS